MKNLSFLFLFSALFFLACGGSGTNASNGEQTNEADEEAIAAIDSLSTEMDSISSEIDSDAKALEDALSDLDEEGN